LRRQELSKYLTQTFMAHGHAMIWQQVTLSGDAEWPKVADAVIEAILGLDHRIGHFASMRLQKNERLTPKRG
jgi:hypothetical protein